MKIELTLKKALLKLIQISDKIILLIKNSKYLDIYFLYKSNNFLFL